jgi:hypothetical protein
MATARSLDNYKVKLLRARLSNTKLPGGGTMSFLKKNHAKFFTSYNIGS